MPHPTVSALMTKAVLAKACAVVMVTGAAGVAYETIPEVEPVARVENVSVMYAEHDSPILAFDDAGESAHEPIGTNVDRSETPPVTTDNEDLDDAELAKPDPEPEDETAEDNEADDVKNAGEGEPDKGVVDAPAEGDKEAPIADVDKVAPKVEILHPADGARHQTKLVVFEGRAEAGSKVHAGEFAASVDAAGNWRIELTLSPGANDAVISATDAAGNVGYQKITVWLDIAKPAEPEPNPDDGKEDLKEIAFTAYQDKGSSDAEVPDEKFWGTAIPNSFVKVTSPYGSGITEVDKFGNWKIKVDFPDAPRDKVFTIKVTGANGSESFEYLAKTPHAEPVDESQPKEPVAEVAPADPKEY